MKRVIILAAFVFALCVGSAWGEVQEFEKFTLDVPNSWTARQEGATVLVEKNDGDASLSITIAKIHEQTLKDVADMFMKTLGGTNLTQDSAGNYIFSLNHGEARTLLAGVKDEYIFFIMNGIKHHGAEINKILYSLKDK